MANCGCGCDDSTTALQGETGADGTTVITATTGMSGAATVEYMYAANRASSASNALDYDWSVITIPAVPATNIAIFSAMFAITATAGHTVTVTAIETGSGAPVAGVSYVQVCETSETISVRFQVSNVVQNAVYAIHLATSDPAVTATLKGGNCQIDIYG